jgi:hypothetical protein
LCVDSVDMQGWLQGLRLAGTKRKRNFSRSESQPSFACVCNVDRNSDRETLEVLKGACVAIQRTMSELNKQWQNYEAMWHSQRHDGSGC